MVEVIGEEVDSGREFGGPRAQLRNSMGEEANGGMEGEDNIRSAETTAAHGLSRGTQTMRTHTQTMTSWRGGEPDDDGDSKQRILFDTALLPLYMKRCFDPSIEH